MPRRTTQTLVVQQRRRREKLRADAWAAMKAALSEMYLCYAQEYLLRSEVGLGDEEIELAKARAQKMTRAALALAEECERVQRNGFRPDGVKQGE